MQDWHPDHQPLCRCFTCQQLKEDTVILPCSCKSTYQDERYGVGQRVHNECNVVSGKGYRCTVCGTVMTPRRG